ncbi:hypothetical protein RchiOBHm_Chr2g0118151 [Rosa chinensis]|uniref:Uncharacterized protein n=1 Tax=Rosa chinensis TaxID=74649 RepID=A0A2P6RRT8_ROSCH|nr:hypothetical protein RchiOBHm_Chr2g0118151 [Rosa chinensis]
MITFTQSYRWEIHKGMVKEKITKLGMLKRAMFCFNLWLKAPNLDCVILMV